uniref:Protein FAR1-RELATED SEQUENCE n=1 Tax=Lactuca sativa TaxID=4236 RepID=A0A9R1XY56_LACSA|nr:hypothetical protein LSAT_V11C100041130 [Lactuca sativa]
MDEFLLNKNNWFNEMYKMRDLWILAYFKECRFSGLMRTTSRSEAENYFYGLLSNLDLHLIEFSNHFYTALKGQIFIQRKKDHDSRYTKSDFKTGVRSKLWFILCFSRKMYFCVLDRKHLGVYGCIRVYGRKPIYGPRSPAHVSLVYI